MTPPLVTFGPDDAPALLALSESIGWPHELRDWQTALAASRIVGHRADETVLSSSSIYTFGSELAALALVIVREEFRGRGLARAAVIECLRQAADSPVILVATEFGEPLYRTLGFVGIDQIVRLIQPEGSAKRANNGCREMTAGDLRSALDLDRMAYGADRSLVLGKRWSNAARGVMLEDAGGFAWLTRQRAGYVIGPVIAPAAREAAMLVSALAQGIADPVKIEVPETQREFIEEITSTGFAIDSRRALMVNNRGALPGRRQVIFALASLGYG